MNFQKLLAILLAFTLVFPFTISGSASARTSTGSSDSVPHSAPSTTSHSSSSSSFHSSSPSRSSSSTNSFSSSKSYSYSTPKVYSPSVNSSRSDFVGGKVGSRKEAFTKYATPAPTPSKSNESNFSTSTFNVRNSAPTQKPSNPIPSTSERIPDRVRVSSRKPQVIERETTVIQPTPVYVPLPSYGNEYGANTTIINPPQPSSIVQQITPTSTTSNSFHFRNFMEIFAIILGFAFVLVIVANLFVEGFFSRVLDKDKNIRI